MDQPGFDDLFTASAAPAANPFDDSDNPFADIPPTRIADPWASYYNEQVGTAPFRSPPSSTPSSPTVQRDSNHHSEGPVAELDPVSVMPSGYDEEAGTHAVNDVVILPPPPRSSTLSPPFREVYDDPPISPPRTAAEDMAHTHVIDTSTIPSPPFPAPFRDVSSSGLDSPARSISPLQQPLPSIPPPSPPPQDRKSTALLMSTLLSDEPTSPSGFRRSQFKPPPTPRKPPSQEKKPETPKPSLPTLSAESTKVPQSTAVALPAATEDKSLLAAPVKPPAPSTSSIAALISAQPAAPEVPPPAPQSMVPTPPDVAGNTSVADSASLPASMETDEELPVSFPKGSPKPVVPSPDLRNGSHAPPPLDKEPEPEVAPNPTFAAMPASVQAPFLSPLETPFGATNSMGRNFTSLALGGTDDAGWHTTSSAFMNTGMPGGESLDESASSKSPDAQSIDAMRDGVDRVPSIETAPSSTRRRGDPSRPNFTITVGDPQKVGDPISAHIVYTVHTKTNSTSFEKPSFSVLRRYSDFLWLFETLCLNNPGVIVPPVPEKHSFGRFEDTFVESRRLALNNCIQKIVDHPLLYTDPDLKLFLESDSFSMDIKHRKAEIAGERAGLMASIGSTLTGPKFHETDEWFDNRKTYLDTLESQLRALAKSVEIVAKQRADVSAAAHEVSESLIALASSGLSKQLSSSLGMLGDLEQKAQESQEAQAKDDVVTILAIVDEYTRLIGSVRLAFASRTKTYVSWQNAESDVRRVRVAHEKAKRQGKLPSDRTGVSLTEITQAERKALDAKQEFDAVTKLIKAELTRFEQERVEDFRDSLDDFLEGMIRKQKESIKTWEDYQGSLLRKAGGNPTQNGTSSA